MCAASSAATLPLPRSFSSAYSRTDWQSAYRASASVAVRRSRLAPANAVSVATTAFQAAGASRLYLQVLDLRDLDHLELVATEVARQLD